MTITLDVDQADEIRRDRWQRYLVVPPEGGKPVPYTRATTVAKAIEDQYSLIAWKARVAAKGLTIRGELLKMIAVTDDRQRLDDLVEQAAQAGGATERRDEGTALHRALELAMTGQTVPELFRADVDAVHEAFARHGLSVLAGMTERMCVDDERRIAGTFDLVVKAGSTLYVADFKGLALDTRLPTPSGWTTIRDVQVGDEVIGSDGRPCNVVGKSLPRWRTCYRLRFDDGTSVVADDEHLWPVLAGERKPEAKVLSTVEMAGALTGRYGQRQFRVVNAAPLHLPERELVIDPYVLGCWLGDGHNRSGQISKPLPAMWDEIVRRGERVSDEHRGAPGSRTVYGLGARLRTLGLLHNKHVPGVYLRASRQQRLDLLRGLMDSDGTWNRPRRQCVFTSCSKQLAHDVYELVVSLGWRALLSEVEREGYGLKVTAYDVSFTPFGDVPFIAKADRVDRPEGTVRSTRRIITSIELIPTVTTQCIAVDSPDHTYLCTEAMVPTHNTGKTLDYSGLAFSTQLAIYAGASALYVQGKAKDGSQDRRDDMPPVDRAVALVLHVQPGSGRCDVHEVDIAYGAHALQLCLDVREARTKGRALITPRSTTGTAAPSTAQPEGAMAPSGVRLTRREQIIERLKALKAIDERFPGVVAARWPEGVPALASDALYARSDFDAIDAVLAEVERAAEAPFVPQPADDEAAPGWTAKLAAEPETQEDRAASMGEPWPPEYDDTEKVDDADVDSMLARLGRLTGPGRAWAQAKLLEARDAGVKISLRESRSARAFEISRALATWAETRGDDDELVRQALMYVLGDDRVQPAWPTGAVLGVLGQDEATELVGVCLALESGRLVVVIDAQGERIEEAVVA